MDKSDLPYSNKRPQEIYRPKELSIPDIEKLAIEEELYLSRGGD